MVEIGEKNYLFCYSYHLGKEELEDLIRNQINDCEETKDITYKLFINTVCNKNYEKLGYSYIWTDNTSIFNALIGFNLDGSERSRLIEDEEWKPPDIEEPDSESWASMNDYHDKMTRPMKKIILEPLINMPLIKLSEEDMIKFNTGDTEVEVIIQSARIYINLENKNSIFCSKIPSWLDNKTLFNFFSQFEKDKRFFQNKEKMKYQYPLIKRKNNNCNIIFSPVNSNTASFIINLVKKLEFNKNDKQCLLFFRQNRKKTYDQNDS